MIARTLESNSVPAQPPATGRPKTGSPKTGHHVADRRATGLAAEPRLEALFQDHYRLVYSTAYRVTGSGADAEDVLQTVFLRLVSRGQGLHLSDRPGAYLHRAAVNGALDLLRSRTRAKADPIGPAQAAELTTREPSPESRARATDLRVGLREALAELSERSAEVFALRYFAEKNNKEIAESLGVTQTAVGVMLHRARKSVKERMQRYIGGN